MPQLGIEPLPFACETFCLCACEASALTTEPPGPVVVKVTRMPIAIYQCTGFSPNTFLLSKCLIPTLIFFLFPFCFSFYLLPPFLLSSFCFVDFTFLFSLLFFFLFFLPIFFPIVFSPLLFSFLLLCLLFTWYVQPTI